VGQPFTVGLSTIPAIVLGHVARRQIRKTGEDGAGLALSGLILGWVGAALIALIITVVVIAAIALTNTPPTSG
jgi:hypothetical protein